MISSSSDLQRIRPGFKGEKKAIEAFKKIAGAKAAFISRGDDSGTHTKEQTTVEGIRTAPGKENQHDR